MNQDYIVLAILIITVVLSLSSIIKNLFAKKSNNSCGGCTACDLSKSKSSCH